MAVPVAALKTAPLVKKAEDNAGRLEQQNQQHQAASEGQAQETSMFDVWAHTAKGLDDQEALGGAENHGEALLAGLTGDAASTDADSVGQSMAAQGSSILQQGAALLGLGDQPVPQGVLGKIGAGMGILTSIEQLLSTPLGMIPFPAFPALRITDYAAGLPHGHCHPPTFGTPLPNIGPVIPIPLLSGANQTLINGLPAARCGDMGIGAWCGGYFPMYEIFLGSSNVWIEGARAARLTVDITKHCVFSSPRPSDPPAGPMIGATISASPNVFIGGIPLPSLSDWAIGKMFKRLFRGLGKAVRKIKAAKAAKAAGQAPAGMFSRNVAEGADDFADDITQEIGPRRPVDPLPEIMADADKFLEVQRLVASVLRPPRRTVRSGWKIRIKGPADFRNAVINDLYRIASTKKGKELFEKIKNMPDPPDGLPHRIIIEPLDETPAIWADEFSNAPHCQARGDGGYLGPDGKRGSGESSYVRYDPYDLRRPGSPPDATLNHELGHAARNGYGENLSNGTFPEGSKLEAWTNLEEWENIHQWDNPYRNELGYPQRRSHRHLPSALDGSD